MGKRWPLGVLGVSSLVMLAISLVGGAIASIAFAFLAVVFPAGLMLLGVERGGRPSPARWPILAVVTLLAAGVAGTLWLPGATVGGPRVFGVPLAVAVQLVLLLAAPLAVVAVGFGLTFDAFAPNPEDVARLRRETRDRDAG